ncbi:multidrug resistance protein, MATE family [Sphingomonas gellani]|uniref:Multidrug resistance protein, MATE family n=1 Tax=Sphingomonas gellani TaxID=1166340 RepID=A0A1H8FZV7_9SPHN|nr:MATE family efflux transporter [Sphingomonas gellani]SEN37381.1 multidrug resistance protein, MATE family [Sphingomonas gellani]
MAVPGAPMPLTGHAPDRLRGELVALGRLAGPLVAANLLQMAVYAVDVVFVARLGTRELAAATLGVFLFSLTLWALMSLVSAGAPLIAAELGRRRHAVREVRRTFRMSLWLGVLASLPVLLMLAHGETLLRWAGQDPDVARRAGAFLDLLLIATVPATLTGAMRGTAAALGRPGWALGVTCMALGLGLLFNWLFVFGHGGMPALGLEGSALASVLTTTVTALAWVVILAFDRKLRRYRLFGRWWQIDHARLRDIACLGAPIALAVTFEGGLFGGAGLLVGLIGVTEVAAHAVALNIAAVAFQIPFGIAQAATIRVGMAFGAQDRAWIGRAGRAALLLGIGVMTVTAAAIWAVPRLLIGGYLDLSDPANAAVIALAMRLLAIAAMFQLLDGAQAVAAGILRGVQDTRVPMVMAAVGYWAAGLGAAVLMGFGLRWGAVGVWLGLAVGLGVTSALLLWRWTARARLGLVGARSS